MHTKEQKEQPESGAKESGAKKQPEQPPAAGQ